jgi:hypothetical protein
MVNIDVVWAVDLCMKLQRTGYYRLILTVALLIKEQVLTFKILRYINAKVWQWLFDRMYKHSRYKRVGKCCVAVICIIVSVSFPCYSGTGTLYGYSADIFYGCRYRGTRSWITEI